MEEIKSFKFKNGRIYFYNNHCILIPANTILLLYKYLLEKEDIYEKIKIKIIQEGYFIANNNNKNNKVMIQTKKINNILKILNSFGFGELKIKRIIKNKIIFKLKNQVFSILYSKYFNKTNEDFFIINLLKGALINIYNENVQIETKTNKKETFLFVTINNIENNIEFSKTQKNDENNKNTSTSIFIKKIISTNQLKIKNGILNMWRMYLFAIPIEIFNIAKNKENVFIRMLFIDLGKAQGFCAYDIMLNMFGSNNKLTLIKNIISQSELIGVGNMKIFEFKKDSLIIEIETDILIKNELETILGEYIFNIILSVIEKIFNKQFYFEIKKNKVYYKTNNNKIKINKRQNDIIKILNISNTITIS